MPHRGWTDYATTGMIAALAFLISPPGIALATGRADLSFRVTAVSVVLAAFLLLIAASIVVQGRVRQMLFVLLAMVLPVAGVACLELAAPLVSGAELNREAIRERLDRGHLDATTLMEYLVRQNIPLRTAHELTGKLVRLAIDRGVRVVGADDDAIEGPGGDPIPLGADR